MSDMIKLGSRIDTTQSKTKQSKMGGMMRLVPTAGFSDKNKLGTIVTLFRT